MGPQEDDPRASEASTSAAVKKKHRFWSSILMWAAFTTLCAQFTGVGGLKNVRVVSPGAVAVGETAALECQYDLEGAELYAVKWYKGKKEFYRYLPKEDPPTKVFPLPGINVDLSESDAHHVVLRDAGFTLTGRYRCEVSADAPSFDTALVVASLVIVEDEAGDEGGENFDPGEDGEEEGEIVEEEETEEWDEEEDDEYEWGEEEGEVEEDETEEEGEELAGDHLEQETHPDGEKLLRDRGRTGLGIVGGRDSNGPLVAGEGRLRGEEDLELDGDESVGEWGQRDYNGKPEDAQCEINSAEGDDCEVGRRLLGKTEEWGGEYGNGELWEAEKISRSAWRSGPRGCDDTEADLLENMGGKQARWLGCDGDGAWASKGVQEEAWDSWIEEEEDEEFDEGTWALNGSVGCYAGEIWLGIGENSAGAGECHFESHGVEVDDVVEGDIGGSYDDSLGDKELKRLNMDQLILNILEGLSKVIDGVLEVVIRLIDEGRYLEEEELDEDVERDLENCILRMREESSSPSKKKKKEEEKEWEKMEKVEDGGRLTKFIEGIRSYGQRELKVEGNDVVNYIDEGGRYEWGVGNRGAIDFNEEGVEREDETEGEDFFQPEEDLEEELMSVLPGVGNDGARGGGAMLEEGDILGRGPRMGALEAVKGGMGAGGERERKRGGCGEGTVPIVWNGVWEETEAEPCRAVWEAEEGVVCEGEGAGSLAGSCEVMADEETPAEVAQFLGVDREFSREREDEVPEGSEDALSQGISDAAAGKHYNDGEGIEVKTADGGEMNGAAYFLEKEVEMEEDDSEESEFRPWNVKNDIHEDKSNEVAHQWGSKFHDKSVKEIMEEKDLVNNEVMSGILERELIELNDVDYLNGDEKDFLGKENKNGEEIDWMDSERNNEEHDDCTSHENEEKESEEQDGVRGLGTRDRDCSAEENEYDYEEIISGLKVEEYGGHDENYDGDTVETWNTEMKDLDIDIDKEFQRGMGQEKQNELKTNGNENKEYMSVEYEGKIKQEVEDEDFVDKGEQNQRENFSHSGEEMHEHEQQRAWDDELTMGGGNEQQNSYSEENNETTNVFGLKKSDERREEEFAEERPVETSSGVVSVLVDDKGEIGEDREGDGEKCGIVKHMEESENVGDTEGGLETEDGEEELEEERDGRDLDTAEAEKIVQTEGVKRVVANEGEIPEEGDEKVSVTEEREVGSKEGVEAEELHAEDAVVYSYESDEEIKVEKMEGGTAKFAKDKSGSRKKDGDDSKDKELIFENDNEIVNEVEKAHTPEGKPEKKQESVLVVKLIDTGIEVKGSEEVASDDNQRETGKEADYFGPVVMLRNGSEYKVQYVSESEAVLLNKTDAREIVSGGMKVNEKLTIISLEIGIDEMRNGVKGKETSVEYVTLEEENSAYVNDPHLEKNTEGQGASQEEDLTTAAPLETREEYQLCREEDCSKKHEINNVEENEDGKQSEKECDFTVDTMEDECDVKQYREEWGTLLENEEETDESKRNKVQREEEKNVLESSRAENERQSSEEEGLRLGGESAGDLTGEVLVDEAEKGEYVEGAVKNETEQEGRERRANARTDVKMENAGIKEEDWDFSKRELQRVEGDESGTEIRVEIVGEGRERIGGEKREVARRDFKIDEGINREKEEKDAPWKGEERDLQMKVRELNEGMDRVDVKGSREMYADDTEGELRDESLSGGKEKDWEMEAGHAGESVSGELRRTEGIEGKGEVTGALQGNIVEVEKEELVEEKEKQRKGEEGGIRGRDAKAEVRKGFNEKGGRQDSLDFWKGSQGEISKRADDIKEGLEEREERQRITITSAEEVENKIERAWQDQETKESDQRVRAKDEHSKNGENHAGKENGGDVVEKFERNLRKTVSNGDNAGVKVRIVEERVKILANETVANGQKQVEKGKDMHKNGEGEQLVSEEGDMKIKPIIWNAEKNSLDQHPSQTREATEVTDASNGTMNKGETNAEEENRKISGSVKRKEENCLGEGQVPNYAYELGEYGNVQMSKETQEKIGGILGEEKKDKEVMRRLEEITSAEILGEDSIKRMEEESVIKKVSENKVANAKEPREDGSNEEEMGKIYHEGKM